jgi:hypothetical protein
LPHFPGALKSERPLLPRRAGALWEGPVPFCDLNHRLAAFEPSVGRERGLVAGVGPKVAVQ